MDFICHSKLCRSNVNLEHGLAEPFDWTYLCHGLVMRVNVDAMIRIDLWVIKRAQQLNCIGILLKFECHYIYYFRTVLHCTALYGTALHSAIKLITYCYTC